ncbi:MAG: bifunctional oligoribonuclease/PAP phosphatase NrnA [Ruminococcaceae bacterium]|nr:bifunctional oligoribonuclease/PAP phosphatase NrnA [Oscillospiraceae bacterium]
MTNDNLLLIADAIKKYDTFSILPHINPDSDAMGSCYAIKYALESMGKCAVVYTGESLPKHLEFLGAEYSVFDKAQEYDACLCIDCGDIGRIGDRKAFMDLSKLSINVDHHYANSCFADMNYVDASACSAGEICYELINLLGVEITKECAFYLYSAICADTGGFRFSNTTPKALRIAADLLECGIDVAKINKALFDTQSFDQMRLKGEIAKEVALYADGFVGVACVTKDMLSRYGISEKDIDNIVDIARSVEGVEVAVSIKEGSELVKVSLRSNEYIDVSKIAAKFGGGGHVRASGFVMSEDFETAKQKIIDEVIKTVKEYKK